MSSNFFTATDLLSFRTPLYTMPEAPLPSSSLNFLVAVTNSL
uniref:Uncharacterized protein n=1 Tax=Arundo donax TaxID=35708 RepID=A0A0A8ZIW2_ARUDO